MYYTEGFKLSIEIHLCCKWRSTDLEKTFYVEVLMLMLTPSTFTHTSSRSGATWTTDRRELINAFEINTTLIIPDMQGRSARRGLPRYARNDVIMTSKVYFTNLAATQSLVLR